MNDQVSYDLSFSLLLHSLCYRRDIFSMTLKLFFMATLKNLETLQLITFHYALQWDLKNHCYVNDHFRVVDEHTVAYR